MHGGTGGTENLFKLEPGEHIIGAQGQQNGIIKQIYFTTNLGENANTLFCCDTRFNEYARPSQRYIW